MNGKLAKKIRRATRRNWSDYYNTILELPFFSRLDIAWYIITHNRKAGGKHAV